MKKILSVISFLTLGAILLSAQSRTSYFVRNSTQNHYMNAAFVPDQGYVGVPFLNGFDIQLGGNFGPSTFLYPLSNGKTGLFLNEEVSSEAFLAGPRNNTSLDLNFGYNVVDAGWFTGKDSFWTISLGMDVNVDSSIPKEFFRFLKNGMTTNPRAIR